MGQTPGRGRLDGAGVSADVGMRMSEPLRTASRSTDARPGRKVDGQSGPGGLAERIVCPADRPTRKDAIPVHRVRIQYQPSSLTLDYRNTYDLRDEYWKRRARSSRRPVCGGAKARPSTSAPPGRTPYWVACSWVLRHPPLVGPVFHPQARGRRCFEGVGQAAPLGAAQLSSDID